MSLHEIKELDQATVDKIAAGEVVERPASVVKELVENAIDANATAITVEIKDGGITFIRVTDDGDGIEKEQLAKAFLRHSTSKIQNAEDLERIHSLGFRGEALSSIAAVSKTEVITKTREAFVGSNYIIHGGKEIELVDIGAPEGTTMFVRQLFYNTPARRKFLKSPMTEGNYITELMEHLALSHPDIAFRLLHNNAEKLLTSGNGSLKDAIYAIYGKQITKECLPIEAKNEHMKISGFIGTPAINRGNRLYETFFVNGRYVKSKVLQKALEEGYAGFLMQHQYPFCVMFFDFEDGSVDVNVHPTKQDVRFFSEKFVFDVISFLVHDRLSTREDVAEISLVKEEKKETAATGAEPFEKNKLAELKSFIAKAVAVDSPYTPQYDYRAEESSEAAQTDYRTEEPSETVQIDYRTEEPSETPQDDCRKEASFETIREDNGAYDFSQNEQISFLSEEAKKKHRIVGQVFGTYWIVEYDGKMYIIDQHAAHEKVLYEQFMEQFEKKEMTSQQLSPPIIVTLSDQEAQAYQANREVFEALGYAVSSFGGKEYALTAVPGNLYHIDERQMFLDAVAMCTELKGSTPKELVTERVASISCKAAVKGNNRLSLSEVDQLIGQLLSLENPYHCPHGRPTIISMTKNELDKSFKRIV